MTDSQEGLYLLHLHLHGLLRGQDLELGRDADADMVGHRGYRPVYFAQQSHAWGILEALHHFDRVAWKEKVNRLGMK